MRVFLTGGTGFIGGQVTKRLRERGDDVVALVRSPARATALLGMGCELLEGSLDDRIVLDRGAAGADAVVHIAGWFEVGIPKEDGPKMDDTNVGGTRRVLDAAVEAGVGRIVYASTINVFGNTNGAVVDEHFRRDESAGFLSRYDESKYLAHKLAERRIAAGAPVIIVQPGAVYGPGDHSEVGREILLAAHGRLPLMMLGDMGINLVHIDDVADGMVAALDRGTVGESYVLGGENARLADALRQSASLAGRPPPALRVPTRLLRTFAPLGKFIAPRFGYPPNLRELIRAADGVTYWASSAKAAADLGYESRSLADGIRDLLQHEGFEPVEADPI